MKIVANGSAVARYISDLLSIHNETARKERFVMLLCELFPNRRDQINRFTSGAESYLSVRLSNGQTQRGFVDTLFGNLIIEFEHALPRMLPTATEQLRGYVAQLWSSRDDNNAYICIATDGARWHVYSPKIDLPRVGQFPLRAADIVLNETEAFNLDKNDDQELFATWLDRMLFRENHLKPEGKAIAIEFGQRGHVYVNAMSRLEVVSTYVKETPEFKTAILTWARYLRYTYGDLDAELDLFLRHSYMSAFSKLLMASLLGRRFNKHITHENILDVINGKFFAELKVQNYCEKDFFGWLNDGEVSGDLKDLWFSIFNTLAIYDFSNVQSDFLKNIYQELVDPKDRHDLGEYYTPDWLCERLVSDLISADSGIDAKIADITCGSGSFLRAAIVRLRSNSSGMDERTLLKKITSSIFGFEIHPLAAFIAKTNYLIAISDLINRSSRPTIIPVFLCDSLLTPMDGDDLLSANNIRFRIGPDVIELPKTLTTSVQLLTDFVDHCDHIATLRVNSADKTDTPSFRQTLKTFFARRECEITEAIIKSASDLIDFFRKKKRDREDSIWAFIIKNNLQPYLFKQFFDVVVGNPPWLSFRYISDEDYRKEIEWLGIEKYKVAPKSSSLRTQMELATIFLAHACGHFLKPSGKVGFVMPRSVFSADHHSIFRENKSELGMQIVELWDLSNVQPLFRVPTCVVISQQVTLRSELTGPALIEIGESHEIRTTEERYRPKKVEAKRQRKAKRQQTG